MDGTVFGPVTGHLNYRYSLNHGLHHREIRGSDFLLRSQVEVFSFHLPSILYPLPLAGQVQLPLPLGPPREGLEEKWYGQRTLVDFRLACNETIVEITFICSAPVLRHRSTTTMHPKYRRPHNYFLRCPYRSTSPLQWATSILAERHYASTGPTPGFPCCYVASVPWMGCDL